MIHVEITLTWHLSLPEHSSSSNNRVKTDWILDRVPSYSTGKNNNHREVTDSISKGRKLFVSCLFLSLNVIYTVTSVNVLEGYMRTGAGRSRSTLDNSVKRFLNAFIKTMLFLVRSGLPELLL